MRLEAVCCTYLEDKELLIALPDCIRAGVERSQRGNHTPFANIYKRC
jgi:hypothetical protein